VWTWTALDSDSKLFVSWLVGSRDAGSAFTFMNDVAERIRTRVQLTTDGHKVYVNAVEDAFGADVDYAMLTKIYGSTPENETRYSPAKILSSTTEVIKGDPNPKYISTSFVERQNLRMRMGMRRFTRLTNGFSKKVANHEAAVAFHFMHYNFCRVHQTLRVTRDGSGHLVARLESCATRGAARRGRQKGRLINGGDNAEYCHCLAGGSGGSRPAGALAR
jgi:IS1 family transposase